jgi:hypothetical protein
LDLDDHAYNRLVAAGRFDEIEARARRLSELVAASSTA